MTQVKARSYTLRTESGTWLGQIVLTSDGMFSGVTDYGNLGYSWRSFGKEDFREFICGLNIGYFATKLATGLAYVSHGKKQDQACARFAEHILEPLQKVLSEELEGKIEW